MENNNPIPWYGYMMMIMIYVAPIIVFVPAALITDLMTGKEVLRVFLSPHVILITLVIAGLGAASANLQKKKRDQIQRRPGNHGKNQQETANACQNERGDSGYVLVSFWRRDYGERRSARN